MCQWLQFQSLNQMKDPSCAQYLRRPRYGYACFFFQKYGTICNSISISECQLAASWKQHRSDFAVPPPPGINLAPSSRPPPHGACPTAMHRPSCGANPGAGHGPGQIPRARVQTRAARRSRAARVPRMLRTFADGAAWGSPAQLRRGWHAQQPTRQPPPLCSIVRSPCGDHRSNATGGAGERVTHAPFFMA